MSKLTTEQKMEAKIVKAVEDATVDGNVTLRTSLQGEGRIDSGEVPKRLLESGDEFTVPQHIALALVRRGYAEPVKAKKAEKA